MASSWNLQGLDVYSWTAFEHGFPVTVEFFWRNGAGQLFRQTVGIWNRLPNGGFELGAVWQPNYLLGWSKLADTLPGLSSTPLRVIWRKGITRLKLRFVHSGNSVGDAVYVL